MPLSIHRTADGRLLLTNNHQETVVDDEEAAHRVLFTWGHVPLTINKALDDMRVREGSAPPRTSRWVRTGAPTPDSAPPESIEAPTSPDPGSADMPDFEKLGLPTGGKDVVAYLKGFPGIGARSARLLVDTLGSDLYAALYRPDPRLADIIGQPKATSLGEAFREDIRLREAAAEPAPTADTLKPAPQRRRRKVEAKPPSDPEPAPEAASVAPKAKRRRDKADSEPTADPTPTAAEATPPPSFDPASLGLPTSEEGAAEYLQGFRGIGRTIASSIVRTLGDDLYGALQHRPDRIIKAAGATRGKRLIQLFHEDLEIRVAAFSQANRAKEEPPTWEQPPPEWEEAPAATPRGRPSRARSKPAHREDVAGDLPKLSRARALAKELAALLLELEGERLPFERGPWTALRSSVERVEQALAGKKVDPSSS